MELDRFGSLRGGAWLHAGAADAPEIGDALVRCGDICFELNSLPPSRIEERMVILRSLLGSFGEGGLIHSPFRCDFGFNIHIGDNFVGNFNLSILDEAEVNIGNNVFVGPNCCITTIIHALDARQRNEGVMRGLPVTIADNVWIAAGVTILPGVTIGEGTVIGAGSVVTKSIPAWMLAYGSPCRPVRPIREEDKVATID